MASATPAYAHITIAESSMTAPLHFGGNATTMIDVQEWAVINYAMLTDDDIDCMDADLAMQDSGGISLAELKAKYGP
jgi:hypothetical protein